MAQLLAIANYIAATLLALFGLTQTRAEQQTVLAIQASLNDPVVGLVAIHTELATVLADLASIQGDILTLGAPQQTGSPVTLPTTPPAGYGGASASGVWAELNSDLGISYGQLLASASYAIGWEANYAGWIYWDCPFFVIFGALDNTARNNNSFGNPSFDLSHILATDDLLTFITRENPTFSWSPNIGTPQTYYSVDPVDNDYYWSTLLNDQSFLELRNSIFSVSLSAPLWPGLANVTLGTPIAIVSPGDDVAIDCDGVLVNITGVPSWAGNFTFGTKISYRNIGAITFTSDNGDQEFPQTFGFETVVYCPKSMVHAVGFSYRAAGLVTGTITPFTIN